MILKTARRLECLAMEKSRFSSPPILCFTVKKGGTYELTYTVSIPPSRVLEADFFFTL